MTETRKLRVFLCHSSQDKPIVRDPECVAPDGLDFSD